MIQSLQQFGISSANQNILLSIRAQDSLQKLERKTKNKQTVAFCRRQERLRNAGIFIIDEFSMVGRQMLGKILYKVRECLPGVATFGGKDVALAGDLKQATPIGDEPMFR